MALARTALLVLLPALLLGPLARQLWTALPPPYDTVAALLLPPERVERLPAGAPDLDSAFFRLANTRLLTDSVRLFEGAVVGAESVAVTPDGTLLMLDKYGHLHRAGKGSDGGYALLADAKPIYIGPGRPLGYHVTEDGRYLFVCDSLKGLLQVDLTTGGITVLSNSVDGVPVTYANDLDMAENGTIFFTSSTEMSVMLAPGADPPFYDTMRSYLLNMIRGDATGRLLAWDPKTHVTREVLGGLWYANGVAVAKDRSFVAVVETNGFRVMRHWLSGSKAGTTDVLIEGLPGSPDGITAAADGGFWVCLIIPSSPLLRLLAPHRWLRQILSHVILRIPLPVKMWGCIVKISAQGEVEQVLLDPAGERVSTVSAVTEHKGSLFIGNLAGDYVSVLPL